MIELKVKRDDGSVLLHETRHPSPPIRFMVGDNGQLLGIDKEFGIPINPPYMIEVMVLQDMKP